MNSHTFSSETSRMKTSSPLTFVATTVAAAVALALSACATTPQSNPMLEQARVAVTSAQANPQVAGESKADLAIAQDALSQGDALLKAGKPVEDVNHQAYIADRFALAAQKGAELETSRKAIADANNRRNAVLLTAREDEAARANQLAQAKSQELAVALAALQASKTDRGLVVTLGDVLFATGRSDLKSGSRQTLDRLTTFLRAYPTRNVQIDGFTDNVGGDDYNQNLSERRADSVRDALTGMGIANNRILTNGRGKSSPVGDNDTAAGRQQNRRVEVLILDEGAARTALAERP
jgi:outer membrane protein OmpA-like peptidoglycan-associated protein